MNDRDSVRDAIAHTYRTESRRILATLIRLTGDFDLAEEVMHEAFAAALTGWARNGIPTNPRAWLISTGRFKAVDLIRRRTRLDAARGEIAEYIEDDSSVTADGLHELDPNFDNKAALDDDQLRLIFMCCHPALSPDAQIALTLREVCGLRTEEIARAFLTGAPTIAQRIVRAKSKIRDAGIPFAVPDENEIHERLQIVLHVVYLVFNEGYSASSGESHTRAELCAEAIRLARLILELIPHRDVEGLLALMLLHDARRNARVSSEGDVILLDEQDRSRWNADQIAEGLTRVSSALAAGSRTSHSIQAAIAAVHAEARTPAETDWRQIVALYDVLLEVDGSAVIAVNRAAAVAMAHGPDAGLAELGAVAGLDELRDYPPLHTLRAELFRRAGRIDEARASYEVAIPLATNEPARRFLLRRLRELA